MKTLSFRYYDIVLAFFVSILLISNLSAIKITAFGPIISDGGAVLFPLAYLLGDILTEVYGYKYARRAIWTGFGVMLLAATAFTIVQHLPGASFWEGQSSYDAILGFFPRIVLASLCAYLVGEFVNAFILAKLKVRTQGKHLWLRLIGSTAVGQLFDTIVFGLVAFGGLMTAREMFIFVVVGWLFKTSVEIVLLPLTYRVIAFMKRREGVDAYDANTDFTPLHVSVNSDRN